MPKLEKPIHAELEEIAHPSSWPPDLAVYGSESAQLARAFEAAHENLVTLKTPKILELLSQYLILMPSSVWPVPLGTIANGPDTSLDYEPMPPSGTIKANARVYIRGRGRPMPYPLEED